LFTVLKPVDTITKQVLLIALVNTMLTLQITALYIHGYRQVVLHITRWTSWSFL